MVDYGTVFVSNRPTLDPKNLMCPPQPLWIYILLMEESLHQLICGLSHYLQCFIHPRWLFGISEPSKSIFQVSGCCENPFGQVDDLQVDEGWPEKWYTWYVHGWPKWQPSTSHSAARYNGWVDEGEATTNLVKKVQPAGCFTMNYGSKTKSDLEGVLIGFV